MDEALGRARASAAVDQLGWRHLFAEVAASVAVTSMRHGIEVAAAAAQTCGAAADDHLRVDVRPRRVEILLHTPSVNAVTATDVELARAVTEALGGLGLTITAPTGVARPVQGIEVAIDALDIPAVLQFWRAVLGYVDEPGSDEAANAIVDPARQGPSIWFQQMDAPRPQRNRIHVDVSVAHDEALARLRAALAAGGTLLTDEYAPSFWVLADPEGNEACVCTWQDRD